MMLKRFVVKTNERGALFRDGDFERLLKTGRHYFIDPTNRLSVTTWMLDVPMADMGVVDYLPEHGPAAVANDGAVAPTAPPGTGTRRWT